MREFNRHIHPYSRIEYPQQAKFGLSYAFKGIRLGTTDTWWQLELLKNQRKSQWRTSADEKDKNGEHGKPGRDIDYSHLLNE